MSGCRIIDLTPENVARYGMCGYNDPAKPGLRRKIDWFKKFYPRGLRIKAILSPEDTSLGMIEYIPGEHAHRPVDARGYTFIHCLFVGHRILPKGKGHGSALLEACIQDARQKRTLGVAVVTRRGPFMAKKDLFLKKGFSLVDEAKPDFELLALKFSPAAADPRFKDLPASVDKYAKGLTVIRSAQCPYTAKNVDAILETAKEKLRLEAALIELEDAQAAQQTPCPVGTFCLLYNGEVISHHPISNTRFQNIMRGISPPPHSPATPTR